MPRILNGFTVQGIGGTGMCVQDVLRVPPTAGYAAWCSGNQIVGNGPENPPNDRVITMPYDGPYTTLWEGGASVVYAGAGTIAAGLQAAEGSTRLSNRVVPQEAPVTLQGVVPFDVDRVTGQMVARPYQAGHDLCVWSAWNGSQTPDFALSTLAIFGARSVAGYICWTQLDFGLRRPHGALYQMPVNLQARPGNLYQALLVPTPYGLWLLYTDQDGYCWGHPANDASRGHSITGQEVWGLDAEYQASTGQLLVVWSSNQGESAGSLRYTSWSLTDL